MLSESGFSLDEALLQRLSPLQRKILSEIAIEPLTLQQLSKRTGSSVHTVGKQLSLLQMKAKYNPLHKKGFKRPLVKKFKDFGLRTTYSVLPLF